ncbi:hypothetical protein ACE14D_07550 [Streptomyces sp. Act-28]
MAREKSLEGQAYARERGRHGGRPRVVDDDMAAHARSLRANGVPVPEIVRKLGIASDKNQGKRPSVATVYRVLAEEDEGTAQFGRSGLQDQLMPLWLVSGSHPWNARRGAVPS